MSENNIETDDFASASKASRSTFAGELLEWMKHNKKWWLLPMILVILLLGLVLLAGTSGLGAFIYPLF